MRIELDIHNFQSISDATLVFEPGITSIIGSSNSGKTAIMRSVEALLRNPRTGKYSIKQGSKESVVALKLDDQQEVKWVRTSSGTQYHIGDEVNSKCGKIDIWSLVPDYFIQREADGSVFNFHGEYDILFPFGFSPQELFKVLERIVSLDDASSVLKAMNDNTTFLAASGDRIKHRLLANKSTVEDNEKEEGEIQAAIQTYSEKRQFEQYEEFLAKEVQSVQIRFEDVCKLNTLHRQWSSLNSLPLYNSLIEFKNYYSVRGIYRVIGLIGDGLIPDMGMLSEVRNSESPIGNCAEGASMNSDSIECSVALTDVFGKLETLMEKTTNLTKNYLTHKNLKNKSGDMGSLPEAPRTMPDMSLSERAVSLVGLLDTLNKMNTRLDAFLSLPEPPESFNDGIVARSTSLFGHFERHNALKVKESVLKSIPIVPDNAFVDNTGKLVSLMGQWNQYIASKLRCSELLSLENQERSTLSQLEALISSFDMCPLCEAPLTDGKFCIERN